MCLRVAIVGLGPKGLFALERLLDQAHRLTPHARLVIDLFEPHPSPGSGPVYDPSQPEYLRMNLAADRLNMWGNGSRAVPCSDRLSFLDWCPSVGDEMFADDVYPPRAQVGRYLVDGLARMLERLPTGTSVTLRPLKVRASERIGSRWRVVTADGSTHAFDEVLVAVGHRTEVEAPFVGSWTHSAPLIPAVYPVTHWLSRGNVPPGSAVAMRGFALTFLDAALALTEGRGGAFEADDQRFRLRYVPSVDDVGVILPFSRTGSPMLAKPEPAIAASIPALKWITDSGRETVLALPATFAFDDDFLTILALIVSRAFLAANGHRSEGEQTRGVVGLVRRWLNVAANGVPSAPPSDPVVELERSLQVALGLRPPGLAWALGESWRGLYPAIVTRFSGAGLATRSWPAFRRLADQMERMAFGPPPMNAAKLLALIEARSVDLSHLAGAQITTVNRTTSIRNEHGAHPVGAVVNAVLPGAGALGSSAGLLGQLLADRHARIAPGKRGLDVDLDGTCIGADGNRTEGLAAIGRPTEDSVIGNDTLNRSLHSYADRWALRVVSRSAGPAESIDSAPRIGAAV